MITIDEESRQRIRAVIDFDNFAQKYTTTSGVYSFVSPSKWTIEKNLFYLLKTSTLKVFEQKYKMRPDFLSFDEYGTVALAQVLMYVNGIFCIEEFDLDEVVIPTLQSIIDITSDKFPKMGEGTVTAVDW